MCYVCDAMAPVGVPGTRKPNNVMKIRNPGLNWALNMVKRLVGSQKFITDGTKAEGPATALGRRPKNGGELA